MDESKTGRLISTNLKTMSVEGAEKAFKHVMSEWLQDHETRLAYGSATHQCQLLRPEGRSL